MEEWRAVPGYEGNYEASNEGQIRSLDRTVTVNSKFGSHNRSKRGRILKPLLSPSGYLQVTLSFRNVHDRRNVHAVVAETFLGPRLEGYIVCHNNSDPLDNRASNLRYDTYAGNSEDMVRRGKSLVGSRHHMAKLNEADVVEILRLYEARVSQKDLAARYGVSRRQINNVVRGAGWWHVTLSGAQPFVAPPSPAASQ